jgi:hypothetical protein
MYTNQEIGEAIWGSGREMPRITMIPRDSQLIRLQYEHFGTIPQANGGQGSRTPYVSTGRIAPRKDQFKSSEFGVKGNDADACYE